MNKLQSGKLFKGNNNSLQGADKIDELYRPYLIHPTTYMILIEQIMTLMPTERNIILTMNEYELSDINPTHPQTEDSPTHIIIFCIRFLSDGLFQPIGALMIYKYENQSKILAECLKAYINDLSKIGLYVMATVSPPFETFKNILCHLAGIQNFNFYSGVISYSVEPFKEIIHIYDVQFLLIKLQNLFKESDIKFEENYLNQKRHYEASWTDIAYVLTSSKEFKLLSEYFTFNKEVPRRVHIFSEQIYAQLMEAEAQGILSTRADGSLVLLNCIRTFLKFLEQDLVDVKTMTEIHYWDCLIEILQTMQFQKSLCRTCIKETPFNKAHVLKNTSIRRKIDFDNDSKEEKPQTGRSRSRKKRKKLNKKASESPKSGKDIREEALSKILSDDTTVTVHFFNGFESARSQPENCDIDKNNNSSSDDCPKTNANKITKKKWKLKNLQKSNKTDDGSSIKNETSESKGPLKYPRISLKDFSRLTAEEENVLNNENLFNDSRQDVLNNSDSFKEAPSSGGCLKKSITDILNSLNNVQFYSNLCEKNTNVENQNVINEHKDNGYVQTKDTSNTCDNTNVKNNSDEKLSSTNEYLLTSKPKSYGTVPNSTNTNPFTLCQDLSQLNLRESNVCKINVNMNIAQSNNSDFQNLTKTNPFNTFDIYNSNKTNDNKLGLSKPKSNLSDLILSGTDLSSPNLSKFDLTRPNLSHFDSNAPKQRENVKNQDVSDLSISSSDSDVSSQNWPKFDLGKSNLHHFNSLKPKESECTNKSTINNSVTSQTDFFKLNMSYRDSINIKQLKNKTNMDTSMLNRPNLSFLESIESRQLENYRNTNEIFPESQNSTQFDLNNAISNLHINETKFNTKNSNLLNSVETNLNSFPNSGNLTDFAKKCEASKIEDLYEYSDTNLSKSVLNFSKTYANLTFNLTKPDTTNMNLNSKSNLNTTNLSSPILNGCDVTKPFTDSTHSNFNSPRFEFGRQHSTNFDFNTQQNSTDFGASRQHSSSFELSRQSFSSFDFNRTIPSTFDLSTPNFPTFDLSRPTTSSFDLNKSQNQTISSFCDSLDFSKDHFCSKSDEETENSIKASCDNVPTILELLSTVEKSPENTDSDFENNAVTFELLCTVQGIERLFTLLYNRRVKVAKPDAFIVEHIDFLVTIIKERNRITSAAYYGNSYALFNTELAFSTLESNAGLYLVSK